MACGSRELDPRAPLPRTGGTGPGSLRGLSLTRARVGGGPWGRGWAAGPAGPPAARPRGRGGVGGSLSPFLSAALPCPCPRVPGLAALRELSPSESEVRWRGLGPGPETPSPCSLVWPRLPPTACEGPSAPGCQPPRKAEREGPPQSQGPLPSPPQLCVLRKGLNLPESLLPPLLGSGSWDRGPGKGL